MRYWCSGFRTFACQARGEGSIPSYRSEGTLMIEYEDIGYAIEAELGNGGYYASFKVYTQNCGDWDVLFEGTVKWDGCSNWNFIHDHYPLHFCGLEDVNRFNLLLQKIYKVAEELIGERWDL